MTHDVSKPATRFRARPQKAQAETDPPREPTRDQDGYEVGYRKPPKHSQFRRGQSGNPKGRPKGTKRIKSFIESFEEELDQKITVRENGKEITIPRRVAISKRLAGDAISGKTPMMKLALSLILASQKSVGDVPDLRELSDADAEMLSKFFKDASDE